MYGGLALSATTDMGTRNRVQKSMHSVFCERVARIPVIWILRVVALDDRVGVLLDYVLIVLRQLDTWVDEYVLWTWVKTLKRVSLTGNVDVFCGWRFGTSLLRTREWLGGSHGFWADYLGHITP